MLRKSEKECKILDSIYPPTVLHKSSFLEALMPHLASSASFGTCMHAWPSAASGGPHRETCLHTQ